MLLHGSRILGGCSLAARRVVPGRISRYWIPGDLFLRFNSWRRSVPALCVDVAPPDEGFCYRAIPVLDIYGSGAGSAAYMAFGQRWPLGSRSSTSSLLRAAHLAVLACRTRVSTRSGDLGGGSSRRGNCGSSLRHPPRVCAEGGIVASFLFVGRGFTGCGKTLKFCGSCL